MENKAAKSFNLFAGRCPYRVVPDAERRPANALNVEIGWLLSGGSPLVFGPCSRACALGHRWCACGHRQEDHELHGPGEGCGVDGCGCSHFHEPSYLCPHCAKAVQTAKELRRKFEGER